MRCGQGLTFDAVIPAREPETHQHCTPTASHKTYAVWHIGDCVRRLDIVQSPLAASLAYELPTKDTICMLLVHCTGCAASLPSARYILAELMC